MEIKLKPIVWHEKQKSGEFHYSSARVADVYMTIDHIDVELFISHKDMKEQHLPMLSVDAAKAIAEQMVLDRIFSLFDIQEELSAKIENPSAFNESDLELTS